jgi:hypothetical protein
MQRYVLGRAHQLSTTFDGSTGCRLCGAVGFVDTGTYFKHVASHLEEVALMALPPTDGQDSSDSEEEASTMTPPEDVSSSLVNAVAEPETEDHAHQTTKSFVSDPMESTPRVTDPLAYRELQDNVMTELQSSSFSLESAIEERPPPSPIETHHGAPHFRPKVSITDEMWELHRPIIQRIYLDQNLGLVNTMRHLESTHNFVAS